MSHGLPDLAFFGCYGSYPYCAWGCFRYFESGPAMHLPPQFPHQRARRVAEQLLHRGRVELVDAFELLGMDAAGHEQAIDAEAERTGEVGAYGIADRQHPVERRRPAAAFGGECHGAFIDRPVRLAVEDHLAAELAIELGDGARAIDQAVAAFDDDVGVGTHQRQ